MLGLNEILMIQCDKCNRAWSLDSETIEFLRSNRDNIRTTTKCKSCDHEFSYINGIINGMTSDNSFSALHFISDIIDGGICEIIVGHTQYFKYNMDIPVVNDINITCQSGFATVKAIPLNEKEFMVISSQIPDGVKVGDKLNAYWGVYGRSGWDNFPIWQRYLVQAKEEILSEKFNLSLLTCEMAFASFIDSTLYTLLTLKGLSGEASHTILESMSSIYDKVHKLLLNLDNIRFADYKDVNKSWMELVKKRNKVGHGEIADISYEEAKDAFSTVVKGILYISLATSIEI